MAGQTATRRCALLRTCIPFAVVLSAFAIMTLTSAHATEPPKQGPVAAYSFDEGEGTTVEDVTGDGHTGTIHGAEWNPRGKYGGSMDFDGEGDYLSVPDSTELDLSEELTIEAWVRPGEGPDQWAPLIDKQIPGAEELGEYAYYLYEGDYVEDRPHGGVLEGEYLHAAGPVPKNTWSHVALTFDGGTERLYIDGELVDQGTGEEPPVTEGQLEIGGSPEHTDWFDGRIDEVRIYNRALSAAEVGSDMEAPIQTPKKGPVAAYSFDEGTGETVTDVTGDGHTATIEGAEWTTHGKYGGAMEFGGDADHGVLRIPESPELDLTEELTLEAWVRPGDEENVWAPLIDKVIPGAEGLSEFTYYLYEGDYEENRPHGAVLEGEYLHALGPVPRGIWSHIALTFDGAEERLYVDGELVDQGTGSGPPVSEGDLEIGGSDEEGNYFNGRIDEVRIYDRALDAAEVDSDMEAPIQTPKQGPVAAYSFDEGEGTTVEDVTGDGHTGTIEGAEWTTHGKYGGGLHFANTPGDVVRIPGSPELDLSEELTLEAWVRPDHSYDVNGALITKTTPTYPAYELYASAPAKPLADISSAPWSDTEAYGQERLPQKVWTHLAMTYDGGKLRLYIDGKLVDTEEGPAPMTGEGDLELGGNTIFGNYLQGTLDEVRIYDRALDAAEVDSDMEAPIQTPKQGPVAAYSFDEGEGTTVEDVTGDGHTGTIEGAEWTTHGKYGGGLHFANTPGDVVRIPGSPELDLSEELTLEAWVRPDHSYDVNGALITKTTPTYPAYELYASAPAKPLADISSAPWSDTEAYGQERLPQKVWTHLAMTYDGGKLRLYIDGKLVDTEEGPAPMTGEGDLELGGNTIFGNYLQGTLDEVRIYDRALDAAEVDSDMEAPIQTPKQGPVAAYSFDEGEGTTVEDVTGDGHTGTIHGAEWNPRGKYGGSMDFDGEGDYLSVPDSTELDLSEELTIEAWVRPGEGPDQWAPLIDKQIPGAEELGEYAYYLYEGDYVEDRPHGGVLEGEYLHAAGPVPKNTWSHVALTFDGGTERLYIDGELVDQGTGEEPPVTEGQLEIGGSPEHTDWFDGRIDEVRIYNRALEPSELRASMQAPPSVATESSTESGSNSAMLNGWLSANSAHTVYYFEYGLTTSYEAQTSANEEFFGSEEDGRTEVSEAVVDLEPETTYHYRLIAVSPSGVSRGSDETVTTGTRVMSEAEEEELREAEAEYAMPEPESSTADLKLSSEASALSALPSEFYGMMWTGGAEKGPTYKQTENLLEPIRESNADILRLYLNRPISRTIRNNEEAYEEQELAAKEKKEGKTPKEPKHKVENEKESTDESTRLIAKAEGHGLTILPYLGAGAFPKRADWDSWSTFAAELVKYYGPGGRAPHPIRNWEIWNEPNMPFPGASDGEGEVNPKLFGQFFTKMSEAIRGAAPNGPNSVTILSPGLFGYRTNAHCGNRSPGYLAEPKKVHCHERPRTFLAEMGHMSSYDAISLHPYVFRYKEQKLTSKDLHGVQAEIRGLIESVRLAGFKQPVWVTELGFPVAYVPARSEEYSAFPPSSEKLQAELTKAAFGAIRVRQQELVISHAFYYNIAGRTGARGWETGCGLLTYGKGGTVKARPAYKAFQALAAE